MLIWNLGAINQITRTFIYNFETLEWSNGPSLKVDREFPACGMIRDFVTDAKYLIVTGGAGRLYPSQHVLQLNSTEILEVTLAMLLWGITIAMVAKVGTPLSRRELQIGAR